MDRDEFPPIFGPPRRSSTPDLIGFLPQRRRISIEQKKGIILEYSRPLGRLVVWAWPVDEFGQRVSPELFAVYRDTHEFAAPGCLCASADPDPNAFTESIVFRVASGRLKGFWVAACAQEVCKYFYIIERIYPRFGILVKRYPLRAPGELPPPPVQRTVDGPLLYVPASAVSTPEATPEPTPPPPGGSRALKRSGAHIFDDDDRASTPGRRSFARTSSGDSIFSTSSAASSTPGRASQRRRLDIAGSYTAARVAARSASYASSSSSTGTVASTPSGRLHLTHRIRWTPSPVLQLLKLDDFVDGGLSDADFRALFIQCRFCNRWITQRVHEEAHSPYCIIDLTNDAEEREVIDLTNLD
ncbi:hypothetical protein FA95DRAFT_1613907 [Auriscalpium vulgare]|uniref:Uncharacterized protein n=1 Tax=Auriscalpium vulgare TaxID=40419 RepID=A0ACB8R0X6_9AGAM|nr:hypothetical protein FA95DRAFT_1613907 [Auriscalpium vulgare]